MQVQALALFFNDKKKRFAYFTVFGVHQEIKIKHICTINVIKLHELWNRNIEQKQFIGIVIS